MTIRLAGGNQNAEATCIAERAGTVDLARAAPVMGAYTSVDPMGFV